MNRAPTACERSDRSKLIRRFAALDEILCSITQNNTQCNLYGSNFHATMTIFAAKPNTSDTAASDYRLHTLFKNSYKGKNMNTFLLMILAIVIGSAISLIGGALIFLTKKRRSEAILIALPFGAGALLAAAFFDLLPEAFELGEVRSLLIWTLIGFTIFFVLERVSPWFHSHHEHGTSNGERQGMLLMAGDLAHNMIDGIAIGAAFLVNPVTGVITTIAVSAHEIPKELGTFGILLSRGWKDKKVLLANIATAIGTIIAASFVFLLGNSVHLPEAELLAITAGFFIYVAASDIIPDIHEQPRSVGTLQAAVLVAGMVFVGAAITALGV